MKRLLYLFFIIACLPVKGQNMDLIVKTNLDSIECSIRSIVGIGALNGEIKYSPMEKPEQVFYLQKREVFYIQNALDNKGAEKYKPKFFNTNFNYSESYFLKTGKRPSPDDDFLTLADAKVKDDIQNFKGDINVDMWRYKSGQQLKTAGNLLLGSIALFAIGSITFSDRYPAVGYAFIGAGGISMIAGYSFLIAAGNTMQRR